MKNHANQGLKKGLSLISKQGAKQYYVIKKKKNLKKHEMCKTNVKMNIYYG
jgi:hypothetical protein